MFHYYLVLNAAWWPLFLIEFTSPKPAANG